MGEESSERAWLPLGSVVVLEGGNVPMLVIGRKVKAITDGREWDYASVSYPEGYFDSEHLFMFDAHQIAAMLHVGFQTPRDSLFQHYLNVCDFEQLGEAWPPKGYDHPLMDVVAQDSSPYI